MELTVLDRRWRLWWGNTTAASVGRLAKSVLTERATGVGRAVFGDDRRHRDGGFWRRRVGRCCWVGLVVPTGAVLVAEGSVVAGRGRKDALVGAVLVVEVVVVAIALLGRRGAGRAGDDHPAGDRQPTIAGRVGGGIERPGGAVDAYRWVAVGWFGAEDVPVGGGDPQTVARRGTTTAATIPLCQVGCTDG